MKPPLRYFEQPGQPLDKESLYLRQCIDCNCNDCGYMSRDMATYKKWEEFHRQIELKEFERKRIALLSIPEVNWKRVEKLVFMFDKSKLLQYGHCGKFDKPVSFYPNTCQIETQDCFKHRKDHNP